MAVGTDKEIFVRMTRDAAESHGLGRDAAGTVLFGDPRDVILMRAMRDASMDVMQNCVRRPVVHVNISAKPGDHNTPHSASARGMEQVGHFGLELIEAIVDRVNQEVRRASPERALDPIVGKSMNIGEKPISPTRLRIGSSEPAIVGVPLSNGTRARTSSATERTHAGGSGESPAFHKRKIPHAFPQKADTISVNPSPPTPANWAPLWSGSTDSP